MSNNDFMDDYIKLKNLENEKLFNENIELKSKIRVYESEEHIFLGTLLYTRKDGTKFYVGNSRNFVPNSKAWQYNRKLDEKHVSELKEIISKNGYLEGNIDILECDGEYCIVNGQHRVSAIKKIMEDDEKFNMELMISVHPVESFETEKANEIFKATNNSKNVETKELPKIKLQKITQKLKERFPKEITNNPSGRANLHRIDQKTIYNLIQFNDTFNDEDKSVDFLVGEILKINKELSLQSYEELFGSKRRSDKKDKIYKAALDSGFYLGIFTENQLAKLFEEKL